MAKRKAKWIPWLIIGVAGAAAVGLVVWLARRKPSGVAGQITGQTEIAGEIGDAGAGASQAEIERRRETQRRTLDAVLRADWRPEVAEFIFSRPQLLELARWLRANANITLNPLSSPWNLARAGKYDWNHNRDTGRSDGGAGSDAAIQPYWDAGVAFPWRGVTSDPAQAQKDKSIWWTRRGGVFEFFVWRNGSWVRIPLEEWGLAATPGWVVIVAEMASEQDKKKKSSGSGPLGQVNEGLEQGQQLLEDVDEGLDKAEEAWDTVSSIFD